MMTSIHTVSAAVYGRAASGVRSQQKLRALHRDIDRFPGFRHGGANGGLQGVEIVESIGPSIENEGARCIELHVVGALDLPKAIERTGRRVVDDEDRPQGDPNEQRVPADAFEGHFACAAGGKRCAVLMWRRRRCGQRRRPPVLEVERQFWLTRPPGTRFRVRRRRAVACRSVDRVVARRAATREPGR